jgi:predicted ATPase
MYVLALCGIPPGSRRRWPCRWGVREQPGVPAAETLMRVLARRQLLPVQDNCEHVIGAAAKLCARAAAGL